MQREKRKITHRYVMLPTGHVNELAAQFNVSRQTVHSALHFRTKSKKADQIRQKAILNGGHVYEPKKLQL